MGFVNAFVQANVDRDICISDPKMFRDASGLEADDVDKSLCGLREPPSLRRKHLRNGLKQVGLKPSDNDPGLRIGRGIITVTWVDDTLFFDPDDKEIDAAIANLK